MHGATAGMERQASARYGVPVEAEKVYYSTKERRRAVEEYIDYYNNERISSRLNGLSPVEYRTQAQLAV